MQTMLLLEEQTYLPTPKINLRYGTADSVLIFSFRVLLSCSLNAQSTPYPSLSALFYSHDE